MNKDFDASKFLDEVADKYTLVGVWFKEDYTPILDSANDLYESLNIANMDMPISVKEMLEK